MRQKQRLKGRKATETETETDKEMMRQRERERKREARQERGGTVRGSCQGSSREGESRAICTPGLSSGSAVRPSSHPAPQPTQLAQGKGPTLSNSLENLCP